MPVSARCPGRAVHPRSQMCLCSAVSDPEVPFDELRRMLVAVRASSRAEHLLLVQVYAFDVRHADAPPTIGYHSFKPHVHALEAAAAKDDREGPCARPWHTTQLHATASIALRHQANHCVFSNDWHGALELYDRLLAAEPWLPQGYVYRAIILLNRGWRGDALCALRDADTCIALSPNWPKAYETRIRCLKDLDQVGPSTSPLPTCVCSPEKPLLCQDRLLRTRATPGRRLARRRVQPCPQPLCARLHARCVSDVTH